MSCLIYGAWLSSSPWVDQLDTGTGEFLMSCVAHVAAAKRRTAASNSAGAMTVTAASPVTETSHRTTGASGCGLNNLGAVMHHPKTLNCPAKLRDSAGRSAVTNPLMSVGRRAMFRHGATSGSSTRPRVEC